MNKERLLTLAAFLDTVEPAKFDLKTWRIKTEIPVEGAAGVYFEAKSDVTDSELEGCGTTACAVGWACLMPEFIKEGLSYKNHSPTYDKSTSWEAVTRFFGISYREADVLFAVSCYESCKAGPHEVAERIRTVVKS
jgi:hypothetical protein